jgi:hypothetical protein
MPLIPYPDVPNVAGVPQLQRNPNRAAAAGAVSASSATTTTSNPVKSKVVGSWQIVDSLGATMITPDSVLQLEYRGESRISSAPMEQGTFASYNKIASPYDLRLVITCGGNGVMSRDDFLSTLSALANSTALCTVVTPDAIFADCNLASFDYRRQANNGATLIIADCFFQEIRQTASAGLRSTKQASGTDPIKRGSVSPITPASTDASKFSIKGVM